MTPRPMGAPAAAATRAACGGKVSPTRASPTQRRTPERRNPMRILLVAALVALPALAQGHDHGDASDKNSKVPAHEKHPMDPNAPKPTGQSISLKVQDGQAIAYVARPKTKAKGALLLLHEYWGLNDWVKSVADRLANDGYLALAVDLYKGKVATDPKEAMALKAAKDDQWDNSVEGAGLAWLKSNAGGAKVAT